MMENRQIHAHTQTPRRNWKTCRRYTNSFVYGSQNCCVKHTKIAICLWKCFHPQKNGIQRNVGNGKMTCRDFSFILTLPLALCQSHHPPASFIHFSSAQLQCKQANNNGKFAEVFSVGNLLFARTCDAVQLAQIRPNHIFVTNYHSGC